MDNKKHIDFTFGHLFTALGLAVILLVLNGCVMTQDEYKEWEAIIRKQNRIYEENIEVIKEATREQKEKNKALEDEKEFLLERGRLLEKENELLRAEWGSIRAYSRDATANVLSQLMENQDIFFDVRLGNPPHKLEYPEKLPSNAKRLYGYQHYIALIDMASTIEADALIQGVEVYSSEGPKQGFSNEFHVAVFRLNSTGQYVAAALSQPFKLNKKGLNNYRFLYAPLEAKEGDRFGLVLAPGTSIDYDEADMGAIQDVALKTFNGKASSIQFACYEPAKRENTQRPGSRSFAFSLVGTTVRKYIFLFNVSDKIVASQTIKSIDVGFNSLSENGNTDVLRTAYLAVFRFYDEIEKLDIVTLSDKIIISESENTQEYPLMKNGIKGIQVQPGDLIALVLSPGVRVKDLAFTPGKYRIFAREFNTIVPKCQILFKMEPDNGKSKDAKFKVNFSVK